jgi:hypothetical protein
MNLYRIVTASVLVVAAVTLAGCSDDSTPKAAVKSTDVTTTTAGAATAVKITSLEVPPTIDCNGKTSVDITVAYAVEGATRQELYIDGRKVDGTDQPSGSITTWVHCDTLPHTIDVVGYDAKDHHTALEQKVTTNL